MCTKRSTKFELFNREVPFKGVAYLKTWNIPDERHGKHGSNILPFLCDGRWKNVCWQADKESSEVWCGSHGSGLDKRQYTVQLTIFSDGKPQVKPFITFCGKGLRIKSKEQDAWDRRVQALFQEKTWCDESIMLHRPGNMGHVPPPCRLPKFFGVFGFQYI